MNYDPRAIRSPLSASDAPILGTSHMRHVPKPTQLHRYAGRWLMFDDEGEDDGYLEFGHLSPELPGESQGAMFISRRVDADGNLRRLNALRVVCEAHPPEMWGWSLGELRAVFFSDFVGMLYSRHAPFDAWVLTREGAAELLVDQYLAELRFTLKLIFSDQVTFAAQLAMMDRAADERMVTEYQPSTDKARLVFVPESEAVPKMAGGYKTRRQSDIKPCRYMISIESMEDGKASRVEAYLTGMQSLPYEVRFDDAHWLFGTSFRFQLGHLMARHIALSAYNFALKPHEVELMRERTSASDGVAVDLRKRNIEIVCDELIHGAHASTSYWLGRQPPPRVLWLGKGELPPPWWGREPMHDAQDRMLGASIVPDLVAMELAAL